MGIVDHSKNKWCEKCKLYHNVTSDVYNDHKARGWIKEPNKSLLDFGVNA